MELPKGPPEPVEFRPAPSKEPSRLRRIAATVAVAVGLTITGGGVVGLLLWGFNGEPAPATATKPVDEYASDAELEEVANFVRFVIDSGESPTTGAPKVQAVLRGVDARHPGCQTGIVSRINRKGEFGDPEVREEIQARVEADGHKIVFFETSAGWFALVHICGVDA